MRKRLLGIIVISLGLLTGAGGIAAQVGVLYVSSGGNDSNNGLSWATAKATIGNAVSTLGSTCGTINLDEGVFASSSQLNLLPCQQIKGSGNYTETGSPDTPYGSVIKYTGSSGAAIAISSSSNLEANKSEVLANVELSGIGVSAVGIFIGGDPSGSITPSGNYAPGITIDNVNVLGFTHAVQFGNNTWTDTFDHFTASDSSADTIYWAGSLSNTAEGPSFTHWNVYNSGGAAFNHASSGDTTDLNLTAGSCDYNTNGCIVASGGFTVQSTQNHYEQYYCAPFVNATAPIVFSSVNDGYYAFSNSCTPANGYVYDYGGNSQIQLLFARLCCSTSVSYVVYQSGGTLLGEDQVSIIFPRWTGGYPPYETNLPSNQWGVTILDPNGDHVFQWGAPYLSINGSSGFTGTKTAGSCHLTITAGIITGVTGC